jgi:hypothetical protein
MPTLSTDTNPQIEKILIGMLRSAKPERKLQMVTQMNHTVLAFMHAGLKQRNPDASAEALHCMLGELILGKDMAQKVLNHHAK